MFADKLRKERDAEVAREGFEVAHARANDQTFTGRCFSSSKGGWQCD